MQMATVGQLKDYSCVIYVCVMCEGLCAIKGGVCNQMTPCNCAVVAASSRCQRKLPNFSNFQGTDTKDNDAGTWLCNGKFQTYFIRIEN